MGSHRPSLPGCLIMGTLIAEAHLSAERVLRYWRLPVGPGSRVPFQGQLQAAFARLDGTGIGSGAYWFINAFWFLVLVTAHTGSTRCCSFLNERTVIVIGTWILGRIPLPAGQRSFSAHSGCAWLRDGGSRPVAPGWRFRVCHLVSPGFSKILHKV